MKKGIVVLGIITLLIGLTITINKEKKELINITNNENNTLAFFIEEEGNYKETDKLPTSGYKLNEEKSFCSNGAEPTWSDNSLEILSLNSSNTNCYLYFDELCGNACKTILGNVTVNEETPDFSKTSCSSALANGYPCEDTTAGVYKTNDDDGDTYYWRGSVENNYVKFANKYWRIIRINGDGSIRMIYDGTGAHTNGTSTADSIAIASARFNNSYNDNMYVGFKYTQGKVHGTSEKSNALKELESWYTTNLSSYVNKIAPNAGFCGDRTPSTSNTEINNQGGTGITKTFYGGYFRLVRAKTPDLNCDTTDLYTISGASKGNKSLTHPIGLITADEVALAGGLKGKQNYGYYLFNGQSYWTISPYISNGAVVVFYIPSDGGLDATQNVTFTYGLRPVINLRSDIELTGTGTMTDPYVVVGGN